jgi:hypothetical protein
MSKSRKNQDINLINLLLGIIMLFLAFLSIDQKYSYIKNNERQAPLHTLIKRHASYVELQHLKEESSLLFTTHFINANLSSEAIETKEGNAKLLTLRANDINAYLSMLSNSAEIINGIRNYILNSPLYFHIHTDYWSFLTPSSYAELTTKKDKGLFPIRKIKLKGGRMG